MNVNTIRQTYQDLMFRYGQNKDLRLYQFNNLMQHADDELLAIRVNLLSDPTTSFGIKDGLMSELKEFKQVATITPPVTSIPDGYIRNLGDAVLSDGNNTRVEIVPVEEFNDRLSNSLTKPSDKYPTIIIYGGSFYLQPSSVTAQAGLFYIKANAGSEKPLLVEKREDGINKYDHDNSVQLKWPEYMYPKIISIMLKNSGISVGDRAIIEESLMEKADVT